MSTLDELKGALRDTLAARGSLGQIQARVRAEIFNALEETEDPKPLLSHENLVINELIREYLDYNHYKHTLAVLLPETGQPPERLNRSFLAQELGVREDAHSRQIPLLYSVLSRLQQERAGRRREALGDIGVSSEGCSQSPDESPSRAAITPSGAGEGYVRGGATPGSTSRSPFYDSLQGQASRGGISRDVRASRDPDPIVM